MLYSFECIICKQVFDEIKKVEERNNATPCPKCGGASFKIMSLPSYTGLTCIYKDARGNPIWFPKDEKPYFDQALRRTFNTAKDKADYMKEKNIVMDGSETPKKWPVESQSMRDKSVRKALRMED